MFAIEYGENRKRLGLYLGIDVATGAGAKGDFSTLVLIERYQEKTLIQGFPDKITVKEHFMITDMARTRDLTLDKQIQWARSYIENLPVKPIAINVDATRELSFEISLKESLIGYVFNRIIWTGGSSITRDGTKYLVGKNQALLDLKAFISLGKLSIADIPLRSELIKELQGLSFVDAPGGGFQIKSSAKTDDLCMGLCCGIVTLLHRGILERSAPKAVPNICVYSDQVKK
jgi:hypothetical protein